MQHYSLYQIVEKGTACYKTVTASNYLEVMTSMSKATEHFRQCVTISKTGEVLRVVEKHILFVDEVEIV